MTVKSLLSRKSIFTASQEILKVGRTKCAQQKDLPVDKSYHSNCSLSMPYDIFTTKVTIPLGQCSTHIAAQYDPVRHGYLSFSNFILIILATLNKNKDGTLRPLCARCLHQR